MRALVSLPDDFRILRIQTPEEAQPYLDSFAEAYQTIFSAPPYYESFTAKEAKTVFIKQVSIESSVNLLAISEDGAVIGFGFAIPVEHRSDIAQHLRGLIPIKHSFYFSELGVLPAWRRRGIGRLLTKGRLNLIDSSRYSQVLLRTAEIPDASYQMYQALGFEDMGVYIEVSSRRTDGTPSTDRRLFLSRLLHPPE